MAAKTKPYCLGIDCRLSGIKHAGIGRYTENLLKELIKLNQTEKLFELKLFFFDLNQAKSVLGEQIYTQQYQYQLEVIIVPIRHYSLAEQLKLPKIYRRTQLDLLHIPHFNAPIFYRGHYLITIHDLLWHEQKGLDVTTLNPIKYFFKYFAYRQIVNRAIKKAQVVFVPAETIKKTVLKYYPQVEKKIIITKEGIADYYQRHSLQLLNNSLSKKRLKKQLVYTGSLYPHKNLVLVIKALAKLPKYRLLIVGSRSVFQTRVRNLVARYKVKKQVDFLGYLTDEQLLKLYQESLALVQPSLSEGFGLTGIEAMASGTAVLASDIPVFREVYQNHAIYFDPHNCQSFIDALEKLDYDYSQRENLLKENLKFVQNYSWSSMAEKTYAAYRQILNK